VSSVRELPQARITQLALGVDRLELEGSVTGGPAGGGLGDGSAALVVALPIASSIVRVRAKYSSRRPRRTGGYIAAGMAPARIDPRNASKKPIDVGRMMAMRSPGSTPRDCNSAAAARALSRIAS